MIRSVLVRFLCLACLTALPGEPPEAKGKPWIRYENSYFIAFSNAPEKRSIELLQELETFRAAFMQVGNVEVPADAPKTVVLITATQREFREMTWNKNIGGFALNDGRSTLIVMPGAGSTKDSKTLIRHEYGHALLRYKKFSYPSWYEEGFAELVSSTELRNKGQSFTLGHPTDRARYQGIPRYDWETLISDEFEPHAITDLRDGSSAYAQAWLLAHWVTFSNDGRNARQLQDYFDKIKEGYASSVAFEESFGIAPAALWEEVLKPYTRELPTYTVSFRPGSIDTKFSRAPVEEADVKPTLDYLRYQAMAMGNPKPPRDPLAHLSGSWDYITPAGHCENPTQFSLAENRRSLVIRRPAYVPDGESTVETYEVEERGKGALLLTASDGTLLDGPSEPVVIHLEMRAEDFFCWRHSDWSGVRCGLMISKCPN